MKQQIVNVLGFTGFRQLLSSVTVAGKQPQTTVKKKKCAQLCANKTLLTKIDWDLAYTYSLPPPALDSASFEQQRKCHHAFSFFILFFFN